MLFLEAVARGDWYDVVNRVRESVNEFGFVLGENAFSGILVSFQIEFAAERAEDFRNALKTRKILLDQASERLLLDASVGSGSVDAMLAVSIPDGDGNKRRTVPAVPG